MSQRRKKNALLVYSLLRKEAGSANRKLKKPFTQKQVDKYVKQTLYPAYKDVPKSRLKVTGLRHDLDHRFKKLSAKRSTAPQVYNRLVHEITLLNQKIPEHQQLTLAERRKLISEFIYPQYKGKAPRKIDWNEAIKKIAAELRKQKKDVCDILAVPENVYQAINYFEIDDFLSRVLPPCVFAEVNASQFGVTEIFNTKDYNYYDSGVQGITNKINQAVFRKELEGDTDLIPKYTGQIQLRPGKPNDGNPENYYLTMILVINEEMVEEPDVIKIPKRKKTQKRKKSEKKTAKFVVDRFKQLQAEKSKVKPVRVQVSKAVHAAQTENKLIKRLVKRKLMSPANMKKWQSDFIKNEKAKLDAHFKKGKLKKFQYRELLKQIKNAFK